MLGSVFGRTDFSRIFIIGSPDFFADFVAGFYLLIFVGKSAQKNPPGKSPAKSSKIYTTKIPDTFLQRSRAKKCPKELKESADCVFGPQERESQNSLLHGGKPCFRLFPPVRNRQELSGTPNPWYFLKSIAGTNGGVLRCKWEVYCGTN